MLRLENKGVTVLPQVMVKLLLEISKKVAAAEITITRAVVVDTFGHTMPSEPSLAVMLFKTNGYVKPPLTDKRILTSEQFIGATSVLATDHVTV